jgi:hypothetical protein
MMTIRNVFKMPDRLPQTTGDNSPYERINFADPRKVKYNSKTGAISPIVVLASVLCNICSCFIL